MKHNWTKVFLSAVTVTTLFSACKPTPDTDTPFPPKVSTSVFIGSKNEFVYALDPTTGTKKWECNVNANIEASPVLYNGVLFVGNSSPVLFKIDPNTGARSQSKIGFPAGIAATPLGDEHYIYIASGKRITCIDIVPDTVRWAFDADDNINSTPTIKDTQLVFGCDDGKVYMLDKRNKNVIWKTAAYSTQFRSSPVIDPTPVYFSSSVPVTMDTGAVYLGAQNFKFYAFKRKNGDLLWDYSTTAPITSSPVVYGGNIIFGGDDGKLYNLEYTKGAPRWIMNKATDRIRSSPYLHGQTVYVGSYDKSFYAVNVLDGSLKWTFKTTGLIASSPVVYNGNVYFGSYDKNMYALDTATGKLMWQYAINGLIDCSPSIDPNNSDGSGINSSISGASKY